MEIWVWYTFGSIISMVILSLVDYAMGQSFYKNPEAPTIVGGFFMIFLFIYGLLFHGIDISIPWVIITAYVLGFFTLFGAYYYWKALFNKTSPGTLASIMKLQMIVAFVVGVLIFNEKLDGTQLVGHLIIFGGAMYLAMKDFANTKSKNSYIYPIVGMLLWSVSFVGMDYLYKFQDFWSIIASQSFGLVSASFLILILTKGGKTFQQDFKKRYRDYIILGAGIESFGVAMHLFDGLAYSTGPLSKVTFLRETYPVLLILIALSLRPYFPKYIADEGGDSKFEKIFVVMIMLLGVYLTIK